MFGLDNWIASFSDGGTLALVSLVAIVLGLRHATDPDHLAAVSMLIAGRRERATGAAARLGFAWGLGHASTLFAFGLPIVFFQKYLPERVEQGVEVAVGVVIVALAVSLLIRWRRGQLQVHAHVHPPRRARTPLQAFAIGLVHGTGGSAGVGVLLLASIHDHGIAIGALVLFAGFTALSMALLSAGVGFTLGRARIRSLFPALPPALGLLSLSFGVWYALGALNVAPNYF
jgi:cytochrome c biogenesis protein CcdA